MANLIPVTRRTKILSLIILLLLIPIVILIIHRFEVSASHRPPGCLDSEIHISASLLAPPEKGSHFCFAVYGDTHAGRGEASVHQKIIRQLTALKQTDPSFKFIIITGDIVNAGEKPQDWLKLMQTPGLKELGEKIPIFPAVGNHDYHQQKFPIPFFKFFAPVFEINSPFLWYKTDKTWYAIYYGNSLFLFLDSNLMADTDTLDHDLAQEQYQWAAEHLSRPGFTYKFAVFHHTPFVADRYHINNALRLGNYHIPGTDKYFLDLFAENKVQAVFMGHIHRYERWLERRSDRKSRAYYLNWIMSGGAGERHDPHLPRVLGNSNSVAQELDLEWDAKELFSLGIDGRDYLERNPEVSLSQAFPHEKSQAHNYFHYCLVDVSPKEIRLKVYALDEQKDSFFLVDQAQLFPHTEARM